MEVRHFGLVTVLKSGKSQYPLLQTVMKGFSSAIEKFFSEIGKLYPNQDFLITIEHEDLVPGYPLGFHNLKKKDPRNPNYKPTTPKDLTNLVVEKLESFQYSDKVLRLSKKFIVKIKVVGRYYMKKRMRKAFMAERPRTVAKKGYHLPKRSIKDPNDLPSDMVELYKLDCMFSPPFGSAVLKDKCLITSLLLGSLITLGEAYPYTIYSKQMKVLRNIRLRNKETESAVTMLETEYKKLVEKRNKLKKKRFSIKDLNDVIDEFMDEFHCMYFVHTTLDRDEIIFPESPPDEIDPSVPIVHIHIAQGNNSIDHASYFEPCYAYTNRAGGKTCIACYTQTQSKFTKTFDIY